MMNGVQESLEAIRATIPAGVQLVAVSKTKPVELLMQAYDAGERVFGENKVQEMTEKHEEMPKDIQWHMIGHLQTNKVKYIAPFVAMIQAVDSFELLRTIEKEAKKNNRVIPCLLQFHIAQETTKFGLSQEEAEKIIEEMRHAQFSHVQLVGVMGMATNSEDEVLVRSEFKHLRLIFDSLKAKYFSSDSAFKELSMGMSDDYPLAIEEGSTMVRIGSKIFGARY